MNQYNGHQPGNPDKLVKILIDIAGKGKCAFAFADGKKTLIKEPLVITNRNLKNWNN